MMIKKYVFLMLAAMLSAAMGNGSLLELQIGFENDNWREVLTRYYGKADYKTVDREGGGKCLEIPYGSMVRTQDFPYHTGEIEVSFDARTTDVTPGSKPYHVIWCSMAFTGDDKKEIGHRDILLTDKAHDWKRYTMTVKAPRADMKSFFIWLGNKGASGTLWIDNIDIRIKTPAHNLVGDPGFDGGYAVDHWNNPREGADWDGLKLKGASGISEYVDGVFPDNGKSLHIRNNATFVSNRFEYHGETLFFGGWVRHHNITTGKKEWARANIQLVLYNDREEVIGHKDLTPLDKESKAWKYYSSAWGGGDFRKDTAYVELWLRGFEGSTGDSWFDNVQLVKLPGENTAARKYNATAAQITLDVSKAAADPIRPVWNAADLSYISKIDSPVVRDILARLRSNGVEYLRTREFLQGCRILREIDGAGNPVYDWSTLDKLTDWAVREQRFILTPTIESTPNLIASVPSPNPRVFSNRSTPKDLEMWRRVAYDLVDHWIERYGVDTVSQWIFECWNEPVAQRYFQGTRDEFLQIFGEYTKAMAGIEKKYQRKFKVATFSGVTNSPFFKPVFDMLKERGELKLINHVSMHVYAGFVNSFDSLESSIARIRTLADSYPELQGAALILTEVNGSSMSNAACDSEVAAAFNVKANRVYLDNNVLQGYYFTPIDYMYSNKDRYFTGDLGIFSKSGVPKPAFNSIVLMDKLRGGKRIPLAFSNDPLDGIAVIDNNRLKILLTSFDERSIGRHTSIRLDLKINWPELPRNLKAVCYRVDAANANSYTEWQKLGKPVISEENNRLLNRANELKEEKFTGFKVQGNAVVIDAVIPNNALLYLEFSGN